MWYLTLTKLRKGSGQPMRCRKVFHKIQHPFIKTNKQANKPKTDQLFTIFGIREIYFNTVKTTYELPVSII